MCVVFITVQTDYITIRGFIPHRLAGTHSASTCNPNYSCQSASECAPSTSWAEMHLVDGRVWAKVPSYAKLVQFWKQQQYRYGQYPFWFYLMVSRFTATHRVCFCLFHLGCRSQSQCREISPQSDLSVVRDLESQAANGSSIQSSIFIFRRKMWQDFWLSQTDTSWYQICLCFGLINKLC